MFSWQRRRLHSKPAGQPSRYARLYPIIRRLTLRGRSVPVVSCPDIDASEDEGVQVDDTSSFFILSCIHRKEGLRRFRRNSKHFSSRLSSLSVECNVYFLFLSSRKTCSRMHDFCSIGSVLRKIEMSPRSLSFSCQVWFRLHDGHRLEAKDRFCQQIIKIVSTKISPLKILNYWYSCQHG